MKYNNFHVQIFSRTENKHLIRKLVFILKAKHRLCCVVDKNMHNIHCLSTIFHCIHLETNSTAVRKLKTSVRFFLTLIYR